MDETDRKILNILEENGRASYTDIAEEVGVSEGTVRNRVEKLEKEEIIRKFTIEKKETGVSAIVMVKLSTDADIESVFQKLPGDMTVFEVTGEHDLVIEFSRKSPEELNESLDKIRKISDVRETTTKSVLKKREL